LKIIIILIINYAADSLYNEMIQNPIISDKDTNKFMLLGWINSILMISFIVLNFSIFCIKSKDQIVKLKKSLYDSQNQLVLDDK